MFEPSNETFAQDYPKRVLDKIEVPLTKAMLVRLLQDAHLAGQASGAQRFRDQVVTAIPVVGGKPAFTVTAEMVSLLRAKTDAPLMSCKRALYDAAGDMAKAEELLRVGALRFLA